MTGVIKVLHVWNTAGVGSVIAKFMDRFYGTKSFVVMRKEFSKFDFGSYYRNNTSIWDCGSKAFTFKTLAKCLGVDIVHVHGFDKIIPYIRHFLNKPIVIHYHGSDIRFHWADHKRYWKYADRIFYVTEEMADATKPDCAVLLKNPIDMDLFFKSVVSENNKAFHVSRFADDLAKEYAKNLGLELTIHDSTLSPIPHNCLPNVLRKYEYYIDVKRVNDHYGKKTVGKGTSKLGLEALACGLKVVQWNGKILKEMPTENKPETVSEKLYKTYCDLLSLDSLPSFFVDVYGKSG